MASDDENRRKIHQKRRKIFWFKVGSKGDVEDIKVVNIENKEEIDKDVEHIDVINTGNNAEIVRLQNLLGSMDSRDFFWYHVELVGEQEEFVEIEQIYCETINSMAEDLIPLLQNSDFASLFCKESHCSNSSLMDDVLFNIGSTSALLSPFAVKFGARISGKFVLTVSLAYKYCYSTRPGSSIFDTIRTMFNSEMSKWPIASGSVSPVHTSRKLEKGAPIAHKSLGETILFLEQYPLRVAADSAPKNVGELLVLLLELFFSRTEDMLQDIEMALFEINAKIRKGDQGEIKQLKQYDQIRGFEHHLNELELCIDHADMVLPKVEQAMHEKDWFLQIDENSEATKASFKATMESLSTRIKFARRRIGFLASRVTALEGTVNQWQTETTNQRLYYIAIYTFVTLPLTILLGLFGVSVGGVPWTSESDADPMGFAYLSSLCAVIAIPLLIFFLWDEICQAVVVCLTTFRRKSILLKVLSELDVKDG